MDSLPGIPAENAANFPRSFDRRPLSWHPAGVAMSTDPSPSRRPAVSSRSSAPTVAALLACALLLAQAGALPGLRSTALAAPVISEFLASNAASLLDEDGEASDWIEIHNPDPTPVDLAGWSLTDDATRPTQWRLPARTLAPGERLLVFASGKNRTNAPPAALHTNFRLDATGEYLALIAPDGTTASSAFVPAFPIQEPDVSYGIPSGPVTTDLLAGARVAWLVPRSAAELPPDWTSPTTPTPVAWRTGAGFGLGFDTAPSVPGGTNLALQGKASQSSVGFGFDAALAIDGDPATFTHTASDDNASTWSIDLGAAYELQRVRIRNRVGCCPSRLRDLTVTLLGPDGAQVVWSSDLLNPENALGNPESIVLDFAELNVDAPTARHMRITRTPDPDLSGSGGQGNADEYSVLSLGEVEIYGVESLSFAPWIRTDIAPADGSGIASAFVRTSFQLDDPGAIDALDLELRFGDGLVVHLNGEEILRTNTPPTTGWDATASSPRSKSDALAPSTLDLRPFRSQWQRGTNWLAFQVLGTGPLDGDLLLDARLRSRASTNPGPFYAYLDRPSPGAPNDGGWNLGRVADTKFSHDRGFHTNAFHLTLSTATPDAQIRYTLDGSAPTAESGLVYQEPLPIRRTTVVRAAAFKDRHRPSNVDTHTYVFPADVITQPARPDGFPATWAGIGADYAIDPRIVQSDPWALRAQEALLSLPSISLVTAMDNLFGATAGIYANPERSGIAWERPVSLEWLDPDGRDTFQAGAGLRIQGGYFRQRGVTRKHSLRLLFKDEYGPGRLRRDLFREFGAAREFDTLVLRAGANDGYAWDAARNTEQFLRDEFGRRTFLAMNQPSGRGRFVHVYLNGLYWGLYNLTERPAEDFSATYFGGDPTHWDAINAGDVKNGSLQAWNAFLTGVRATTNLADYQKLKGLHPDGSPNPAFPVYLDAPHYIDYMIVNLWGGNWDWPNKNFWFGRDRTGASGGFKFYVWDFENTMGNNRDRSPLEMLAPRAGTASSWVGEPHDRLRRSSAEYRIEFADRLQRHFFHDGALTPTTLIPRYRDLAATIEAAVIAESARWGDDHWNPPQDPNDWSTERDWILGTYLPRRSAIVLDQFRSQGLYPATAAPTLTPHGGTIAAGTPVLLEAAAQFLLYTTNGIDPRLPGGGVHPSALLIQGDQPSGPPANPDLVRTGRTWHFLATGTDPGSSWHEIGFDDSAWASGPSPLGYGDGDETTVVPSVDVQPGQAGNQRNAATYFRTAFLVGDPAAYASVRLTLVYDDAAAVFLNGREILRTANLPANATHATYATAASSDNATLSLTDLPLTLFRAGTNVLAVQIHQSDASSSDISFDLELTGTPRTVALVRTRIDVGPGPRQIVARARNGTEWSARTEALFDSDAVPASAANLAVAEVHYRPANPVTPAETAVSRDRDDFEFIELVNTGSRPLDLTGVRFAFGILHNFAPGTRLEPGSRLVLVARLDAFQARYGAIPAVAGEYDGRLDNNGEEIALVAASGADIARFRYSQRSPWPDADGSGRSLTRRHPGDGIDSSSPAAWRASLALGGTPGTSDAIRFTGEPGADLNGNGQADLLDHALGALLNSPADGWRAVLESVHTGAQPPPSRLVVDLPRNPAADDTRIRFEYAPTPAGPWQSGAPWFESWEEVRGSDGRWRLRSRMIPGAGDAASGFVRILVEWTR